MRRGQRFELNVGCYGLRMEPTRATLLGPFQLWVGGRQTKRWERPSARRLLQFLLLDPGRPVARDELVNALFPSLDAEAGANALAKALSMVLSAAGPDLIESSRSLIRLAQPVETDLHDAISQLERALKMPSSDRIGALEAALAIRGEPIPEERFADWPEPIRNRVSDLRRRCRFELAKASTPMRTWADTASIWQTVLAADPTNEHAAIAAINAHAEGAERLQAARVYEACRQALLDELGVTPSAALESAYRT